MSGNVKRGISKRALIITPFGHFNFGNRLQNFAVQEGLSKRKIKARTLVLENKYPGGTCTRLLKTLIHRLGLRGLRSARVRAFLDFNRRTPVKNIWSQSHLERISKKPYLFVFGSDQIWNPNQIDFSGSEYGNFIKEGGTRIAISPSFGVSELPISVAKSASTQLAKFDALSVREFTGQELIEKLTGRNARVIIDPTMSVDVEVWSEIARQSLVPSEPYLLVYVLGNSPEWTWQRINDYANNQNLRLVTLLDEGNPEIFRAGPQDFLGLVSGATMVLTDSFHAVIFSLLFNTPVGILPRIGGESMESRFETLRSHFKYSHAPIDGLPGVEKVSIDRNQFETRLNVLKEDYNSYLDCAVKKAQSSSQDIQKAQRMVEFSCKKVTEENHELKKLE